MPYVDDADTEGQISVEMLIKQRECGAFNDWEKRFIQDLVGRKYKNLSKKERLIVLRLIGWLGGFALGVH